MHDPVDHDPPERDRRERQDAEQDRADRKIAGHPPIAQQLADDPAHAERAVVVAQAVVALDQNDFAVPGIAEAHLIERQRRILVTGRVEQHDGVGLAGASGPGAEQDHRRTVPQDHDGRQRRSHLEQILPAQAYRTAAHPRLAGDAQHLRDRDFRRFQLMITQDLLARQVHPAMPRRDDKGVEQRGGCVVAAFERADDGRLFTQRQAHGSTTLA